MLSSDILIALNTLFAPMGEVIIRLGDEFTFEGFRCAITQRQKAVYSDLIHACRLHYNERCFLYGHRFMSERLKLRVGGYGFQRCERVVERNMFGNRTTNFIYRRVSRLG